jgi:hypothetical protein
LEGIREFITANDFFLKYYSIDLESKKRRARVLWGRLLVGKYMGVLVV